MKFRSLLIANRGEIALRVMRTAKRMGLRTIAVYSDADRDAPHARAADAAVHVGGSTPRESYLNIESILKAARDAGAESIHPGYGFLSENASFASEVEKAKLVWIGPPSSAIRAMGDKANAKKIAAKAGVPVLPTYEKDPEFPLMIKALAGGGGRGIRVVLKQNDLEREIKRAQSEAEHSFGDPRVLLEKALLDFRHVEVQVFADAHGTCVHLGERECSIQRRHQKLLEESPSTAVDAKLRAEMGNAALRAAKAVGYVGAGTVEFLLGTEGEEAGRFWFMEMNTRLQVEHPVTEALTGLDLVEWQLRVAAGEKLPRKQEDIRLSGHAIEVRLCAEDPARDFLPQTGTLALWQPSPALRVDHALESGAEITPFYDSMLAKLIVHAPTRAEATARLIAGLDETVALGLTTNKEFLSCVLRSHSFAVGDTTSNYMSNHRFEPQAPDPALAANLLASDYGEWTGWSNNIAHRSRAKFDGEVFSFAAAEQAAGITAKVVDGDTVHYALGGSSFTLRNTLYDPPEKKGAAGSDGRLAAPMNGRVVAVNAEAGQRIEAGKPLVVLEAMKMEHGLSIAFPVKIKSVHVKAGSQVSPGNLLVEFDPA